MRPTPGQLFSYSLIVIGILLMTACGGASANARIAGGPVAPDFAVSTGEGTAFSLNDHGGDVVVLYFSFPG